MEEKAKQTHRQGLELYSPSQGISVVANKTLNTQGLLRIP